MNLLILSVPFFFFLFPISFLCSYISSLLSSIFKFLERFYNSYLIKWFKEHFLSFISFLFPSLFVFGLFLFHSFIHSFILFTSSSSIIYFFFFIFSLSSPSLFLDPIVIFTYVFLHFLCSVSFHLIHSFISTILSLPSSYSYFFRPHLLPTLYSIFYLPFCLHLKMLQKNANTINCIYIA